MPHLDTDEDTGFPVLLAEPRRHEIPRENLPEIITPDGTSGPAEWGRYHDAVREASRSFDNPQEGDIRHFLHARARHPDRVDAPAFHEAVRRHRMADLVDIIDHHMRREGSLPRGSRHIRVQAPKGYLRRALKQSSPEEVAHLRHRLTSIGHDHSKVSDFLSSRVGDGIWSQADVYEVKMSDVEFDGLTFDSDSFEAEWENPLEDVLDILDEIRAAPPVVNVYINNGQKEDEHDSSNSGTPSSD